MADKCYNCENQTFQGTSDAQPLGSGACYTAKYNERAVEIGGVYRHFKGNTYKVLDIVTSADDLELCVVYELLDYGTRWVRSYKDFTSEVDLEKYPSATQKYKFELVEDEVCEACAITYSWEQGSSNVLGETNDADE